MATNACTNTMNAVIGVLAGGSVAEQLSSQPSFDRDGVYALRMAPGDNRIFSQNWNHDLAIVCVRGEATLYQSWEGGYSLSEWLLNTNPQKAALHACATRFSPGSETLKTDPGAGMTGWLIALNAFQTAWNANFQAKGEGDANAVGVACSAAFGGPIGRLYFQVKDRILTSQWYLYGFSEASNADLGLQPETTASASSTPAIKTASKKTSKMKTSKCIVM